MCSKPVPAMCDPCFDETFYFCLDQIQKQGVCLVKLCVIIHSIDTSVTECFLLFFFVFHFIYLFLSLIFIFDFHPHINKTILLINVIYT